MKVHHLFWSLCLCLSTNMLFGQNYQKTSGGIKTSVDAVDIEVQFFTPSVVRVVKSPKGIAFEKQSLSVVAVPEKVSFKASAKDNKIVLNSGELSISIDARTGAISYASKDGKALLAEKAAPQFIDFNDAGSKTYHVFQSFALDKEEAIYGLGQLQHGKMIQRNMKKNLVQGNVEDVSPFFQSTKGYGVFWDNYSPTLFTDNES